MRYFLVVYSLSFSDQNWLPKSCDLTLLNFFLQSYLKSKVYVDNPITPYVHYKRKLNAASMKCSHFMQKGDEKFGWKGAYVPAKPRPLKNKYLKTENSLLHLTQILR